MDEYYDSYRLIAAYLAYRIMRSTDSRLLQYPRHKWRTRIHCDFRSSVAAMTIGPESGLNLATTPTTR